MRSFLAVFVLLTLAGPSLGAVLVDRGLPTANLNNTAGGNRSNVAWAFGATWATGDDFAVSSASEISTIRVWSVGGSTSNLAMYLYNEATSAWTTYNNYTVTPTTYSGGSTYQGSSGSYISIYQLDFAVGITAAAGTKFDFAVLGDTSVNTFLHASNASLSGSTQEGSDNLFYSLDTTNLTGLTGWESCDSNQPGVWDKSSDINVQVLGTVVPEPATCIVWSLFGGIGVFAGWRRRRLAA